jgi:hypothetical protein
MAAFPASHRGKDWIQTANTLLMTPWPQSGGYESGFGMSVMRVMRGPTPALGTRGKWPIFPVHFS